MNNNLGFVFEDCVKTITKLRKEGKRVLLLCHGAMSRTPAIAVAYAVWSLGIEFDEALTAVFKSLPHSMPLEEFLQTIYSSEVM